MELHSDGDDDRQLQDAVRALLHVHHNMLPQHPRDGQHAAIPEQGLTADHEAPVPRASEPPSIMTCDEAVKQLLHALDDTLQPSKDSVHQSASSSDTTAQLNRLLHALNRVLRNDPHPPAVVVPSITSALRAMQAPLKATLTALLHAAHHQPALAPLVRAALAHAALVKPAPYCVEEAPTVLLPPDEDVHVDHVAAEDDDVTTASSSDHAEAAHPYVEPASRLHH